MTELDKLTEKLKEIAGTALGKAVIDGVMAKPADDIAQGRGKKPKNRADLFALAQTLRRLQDSLYTLSLPNDPWMADVDFRSKHAYWVTEIFERFGITRSVIHVRQVHYRLVSQETPVLQVDGTPYVNSGACFDTLCNAIRDARYLDLISTDIIVDRRNPQPTVNFERDGDVGAKIEINRGWVVRFPFGRDYLAPGFSLPRARLIQEPYFGQRYHLEIWIEKPIVQAPPFFDRKPFLAMSPEIHQFERGRAQIRRHTCSRTEAGK